MNDSVILFREAFDGKKCVFIVVVHVGPDPAVTAKDIEVAQRGGADGIALIKDYEVPEANDEHVLAAYRYARSEYPLMWVAVNLLDHRADQAAMHIEDGTPGLWLERSYVREEASGDNFLADVRMKQACLRHTTMLLANVAFKYQAPVKDFALVAKLAAKHCDVVMTSGAKTGSAPDVDKVRIMAQAAAPTPLGLASGVSAENVAGFIEAGAKVFFVNTSISTGGRLDPEKVRALREAIPRKRR